MYFSLFFVFFLSFKGPLWRSWAVFGVLLDPQGAQGGSGPHFIYLFAIFEALWEPRQRQKEPQGTQRRPKWSPKWSRRHPKATSKGYFFEISKTLNLNDSTMIFMVFWCPGRYPGRPKNKKMDVHGAAYGCKGAADASY